MLSFKEELFLLLHYDSKKGAVVELHPDTSELIAAGGILVELLLTGRLRLDEQSLVVTGAGATGDEILDEALTRLAPAQPIASDDLEWVAPIAQELPFGRRLFDRLLDNGVLRREEKPARFGLSRAVIYSPDPDVAQQLVERELNVMVRGAEPNPHTAALLFLSSTWGRDFPAKLSGKEKRTYRKRWDALFGDYWGQYPADHEMEPVKGLDPAIRKAIGAVAVSWATVQTSYVAADVSEWQQAR
jgi:hypothetical protein